MKLLAAAPERCLPLPNYVRVIANATSRRRLAITPDVTTDSNSLFPARRGSLLRQALHVEAGQHQGFRQHGVPEVSDVQRLVGTVRA